MAIDVGPAKSTHRDSKFGVTGDERPNLLGTPDRLAARYG